MRSLFRLGLCHLEFILDRAQIWLRHNGERAMTHVSPTQRDSTPPASATLPSRPDACALSRSIPQFFIGRNKHGFWIAREASGQIGGMFLMRRSALRFAQDASAGRGSATMFPTKTFELDTRNSGNPLVGWLDALLGAISRFIPDEPPPIPITEKYRGRDWFSRPIGGGVRRRAGRGRLVAPEQQ
jgi:hypothetical protein